MRQKKSAFGCPISGSRLLVRNNSVSISVSVSVSFVFASFCFPNYNTGLKSADSRRRSYTP
ncbi:hypothetical protein DMB65_21380 [Flavobacterium cheongpyeongense]|uniref:Uncharacterized protein n=1 Tax=Flavobacterium cheongpyeongense TaxID=2212651 RepID=A0A2V4BIP0_9FLAO|nr:hypothetical protein DMB65_21380 [Flavobacterium cheongpyeongense]